MLTLWSDVAAEVEDMSADHPYAGATTLVMLGDRGASADDIAANEADFDEDLHEQMWDDIHNSKVPWDIIRVPKTGPRWLDLWLAVEAAYREVNKAKRFLSYHTNIERFERGPGELDLVAATGQLGEHEVLVEMSPG